MSARTVRAGVIGVGGIAGTVAADFARTEGIELVAAAGRDAERTRAFADAHGIAEATTIDALLADDTIDLIYVATTHDAHAEYARRSIEAGKATLVEKPITVDAAGAAELFALARERGVFLLEAMWTRFNPVIRHVAERLAAGDIGEPQMVHASMGFVADDLSSRLWDPRRAGGALLDMGVYPLTIADLAFGEPRSIAVVTTPTAPDGSESEVDAEEAILLGYEGGRSALLSNSLRTWSPLNAVISGPGGRIEIDAPFWTPEDARVVPPGFFGEPAVFHAPREGNGYVPMLAAVADAVRDGLVEHPLWTHDDALRVLRTLDRIGAEIARAATLN